MVDHDVFDMEEEESDSWYASLIDTEKEIQSIVNLDPARRKLKWADGSELSFDESVERIHTRHPSHSKDPPWYTSNCAVGWNRVSCRKDYRTRSWSNWTALFQSGPRKFPADFERRSTNRTRDSPVIRESAALASSLLLWVT